MELRAVDGWKKIIKNVSKGTRMSKIKLLTMFSYPAVFFEESKTLDEACRQLAESGDIEFVSLS